MSKSSLTSHDLEQFGIFIGKSIKSGADDIANSLSTVSDARAIATAVEQALDRSSIADSLNTVASSMPTVPDAHEIATAIEQALDKSTAM
jgi:hypothetical protein